MILINLENEIFANFQKLYLILYYKYNYNNFISFLFSNIKYIAKIYFFFEKIIYKFKFIYFFQFILYNKIIISLYKLKINKLEDFLIIICFFKYISQILLYNFFQFAQKFKFF